MKNFIQRYSAFLLTGTILTSAALPQFSISAKSLEQIQAQTTLDKKTSNPATESLPTSVAQRVKREIARRFKIPVSRLQITAAQPRTWDGCFGLPAPNAACTKIAISGWQVIVTGQQRIWVYHTDQNGSQVRINQVSSLTNQPTRVQLGFIPEEQAVPNPGESVVFQSIAQGGIADRTTITKLTNDGIVTRQIIAPNIRSTPVVIKRLTRDQIDNFLEQVRQQRFNHLNRLRYFSDRGADFEATKLIDASTVVEYANPLQKELPPRLQRSIAIWQKLLRS